MDVKDLNKSQLILLAILLSFITSIATGITTVTLMEQAPSSVTVPINRIVQQTVEKIVQVPGNNTTQTVVIKEEDLVVDAISKNQSAVFTLTRESRDVDGNKIEVSAGRAFAVAKNNILVADGSLIGDASILYAKNESGKFKVDFTNTNKAGFTLVRVGDPVDGKSKLAYTPATFADLSKMKIGQKVLLFGGSPTSTIFDGNKDIRLIVLKSNAGGMVLNLDGEVLGIALFGEGVSFASIDTIKDALKALETKAP